MHVQTSRMYKQTVYKLPVGMLSPDTINHNSRDWNPVALHQGAAVLASANHVQILLLWWMHASEAGSFVRRKVSPRLVTSSGTWQLNRTSERMKFGWEASFFCTKTWIAEWVEVRNDFPFSNFIQLSISWFSCRFSELQSRWELMLLKAVQSCRC